MPSSTSERGAARLRRTNLPRARPAAGTAALPLALLLHVTGAAAPHLHAQVAITTEQLGAFRPRPIGPAVTGGRVHDLEAVPDDPSVLYLASASGGLWKTTNRGHAWTSLFDTMAASTFGDVALAPSNPEIVYAGTGEQNNRQSSSWGNGVYRSDDGGSSWRHLGLEETRHVGKIEVDPRDPDVAFVAALGNLWKPSRERGVFRTRDGGRTWQHVLFVDTLTGAVDLVMDPRDPDVLYAAAYQRLRRAWGFNGGGPGSGIYKTSDGGDTWAELTTGIPEGDKGRIGLAVSRSNPRVLMATIETAARAEQGTYRSEDGGATWRRVNELNPRPMYYSEIFIDPNSDQRVYVLGTSSYRSEDGGHTFTEIAARPTYDVGVHADQHALWIDPTDPDHLYMGGDAGLHESYDRGESFRKLNNLPIGQFYAIDVDTREPYNVYGGMQDNHSWMGPSETRHWIGIIDDDWRQTGFGDGMYWQVDPTEPRFAYGSSNDGDYFRLDSQTGDMLDISPVPPAGEPRYRFDWTSPMLLSGHDPATVYLGGNRLFISRDRGGSWERTEDLSRRIDRDTLELMGVAGRDIAISRNDGAGSFGEATTLAESPVDAAVLWVGLDDGNLQVSRDA
ncbi:MAG TPA: glycosyl hydrolase, partial [Candidatus Thermoplasmatota archaeon]